MHLATVVLVGIVLLGMASLANADDCSVCDETSKTKEVIGKFFAEVAVGNTDIAYELMAEDYIQHSPVCPDGREGFLQFMEQLYVEYPDIEIEVVRTIAEGDLMMVQTLQKMNKDHRGIVGIDILRVEDGMIVEHWSLSQEVPEKSLHGDRTMY